MCAGSDSSRHPLILGLVLREAFKKKSVTFVTLRGGGQDRSLFRKIGGGSDPTVKNVTLFF